MGYSHSNFFPNFRYYARVVFVSFLIYFGGRKSEQKLGGITGDILGAIAFLGEIMFLLAVLLFASGAV